MRAYTRVVEQRSFSGAARDMSLSRSTVTEAIQQLEARLGVRLLERTTKKVVPTAEGQAYYDACLVALEAVDGADASVGSASTRGVVRIGIESSTFENLLLGRFDEFTDANPAVTVLFVDPLRTVGTAPFADFSVLLSTAAVGAGRVVGRASRGTFASQAYLDRSAALNVVADLSEHTLIANLSPVSGQQAPFETGDGRYTVGAGRTGPAASSAAIVAALAGAGLGVAQLPHFEVADALARGDLIEVLRDTPPPPVDVVIVEPTAKHMSPQARVFLDWVVGTLSKAL